MNHNNSIYHIFKVWNEKKITHTFLFILSFLILSWWFDYFDIFHYAPYGIHRWRQCDSHSFVQNYYNNGMEFFNLRLHHIIGDSGYGSASEFPILYYLAAAFWKLFQPHDSALRLVNFFFLATGLFSLSRLTFNITKDAFYALLVPLFMMSSPVIAFYGFNYLPNAPALGMTFTATYFFYLFYKTENRKWLIGSWLLFLLAGLVKITVLIPYITILVIFLLEKLNWVQFKSEGKIFRKGWLNLPFLISIFAIIGYWVFWVKNYNVVNKCSIFITKTKPIWSLVEPQITQTWHWVIHDGAPQYFHFSIRYFVFGMAFIFLFFMRKKMPRLLYNFNLFIFLGVLGAFLVFYRQFLFHDYYAIEMMVFPATIFVSFFFMIKNKFPKIGNHWATRITLLAFLFFNLNYAHQQIEKRYEEQYIFSKNYDASTYKKQEAQTYLKSLGIEFPEKIISIPDVSPNFTLNYFNLMGWTEFAIHPQPFEPWVLGSFIDMGAQYLIISDKKYLDHEPFQRYMKYPIGSFEDTFFIFDLREIETDKDLREKVKQLENKSNMSPRDTVSNHDMDM